MAQPAPIDLMNELVARTTVDSGLRQRLMQDPLQTLRAEGIAVPAGMDVKVLENSDAVFYLPLPLPQRAGALSDTALDMVAAAGGGMQEHQRAEAGFAVEELRTAWSRLF